jgi:membrane protein DedA with SNARE-associated domain
MMFYELLRTWLGWVDSWGYLGVFILMAMESSIIPVPSEIVMPPAAFWAAQGRMSFAGVILAGTAGSWVGSAVSYWLSKWVGLPVVNRYGKFFLMPPKKIKLAHDWVSRFGSTGVFAARLLPVIRHLISIPAGILEMPFARFSLATVLGAGLWNAILAWMGQEILGPHPELLQSPEAMMVVVKAKLHIFVAAVVVLVVLYALVLKVKAAPAARRSPPRAPKSA